MRGDLRRPPGPPDGLDLHRVAARIPGSGENGDDVILAEVHWRHRRVGRMLLPELGERPGRADNYLMRPLDPAHGSGDIERGRARCGRDSTARILPRLISGMSERRQGAYEGR